MVTGWVLTGYWIYKIDYDGGLNRIVFVAAKHSLTVPHLGDTISPWLPVATGKQDRKKSENKKARFLGGLWVVNVMRKLFG